jgi:hypothetical protein
MGRPRLEVPVVPVNASIPKPDHADLTRTWTNLPGRVSWRKFITEVLRMGLAEARRVGLDSLANDKEEDGGL